MSLEWKGNTTAMNLCAGRVVTLDQLAETIFAVSGDRRPIVADDTEIRGVATRCPTNTTVGEATGKRNFTPLSEGLAPTLAWYADALAKQSH